MAKCSTTWATVPERLVIKASVRPETRKKLGTTFSRNKRRAVGRKDGRESPRVLERVGSEADDKFAFFGREDGVGSLGSGEAVVRVKSLTTFAAENLEQRKKYNLWSTLI